jgi:hypothetical protein
MIDLIDEVSKEALLHFGYGFQVPKAIEELGELIAALGKGYHGGHEAAVIDEIADVTIMVRQLRMIYGPDRVDERIQFKLNRLNGLMGNSSPSEYMRQQISGCVETNS